MFPSWPDARHAYLGRRRSRVQISAPRPIFSATYRHLLKILPSIGGKLGGLTATSPNSPQLLASSPRDTSPSFQPPLLCSARRSSHTSWSFRSPSALGFSAE